MEMEVEHDSTDEKNNFLNRQDMAIGCILRYHVNVLNLHIIDLARKYHTHLQREIEKEVAREKEWNNSH
jgi:hypothetical protein